MSEFNKIIGYDCVKEELKQICDMIHNKEVYEKLGAKMSKGLLIQGNPGLGKSLMARVLIKESGRNAYTIRRNKHDGDFVNEIKDVFSEAMKNAPSIILLDDMDKFAVKEDSEEEYVAVQACIDEVHFSDVFVIATTNYIRRIPRSLLRAGRFDRRIEVEAPKGEDAAKIIKYYMGTKAFVSEVNIEDIAKLLGGKSCAELETILNEAAIYAGFERKDIIETEHIVRVVLRDKYGASNSFAAVDSAKIERVAFHEAGHIVMAEVLEEGCIGVASLREEEGGEISGFVTRCESWDTTEQRILTGLAGKASVELQYGIVDRGAGRDLDRVIDNIRREVLHFGKVGMGIMDVSGQYGSPTDRLEARQEIIVQAELARYFYKAKEILVKNRAFINVVVAALIEKKVLLNSDIKKLREKCEIVNSVV